MTDIEKIRAEMREAAKGEKPESAVAAVRKLLPEIRGMLAAGRSFGEAAGILNRGGVAITPLTLRTYYYRFEKERRNGETEALHRGNP